MQLLTKMIEEQSLKKNHNQYPRPQRGRANSQPHQPQPHAHHNNFPPNRGRTPFNNNFPQQNQPTYYPPPQNTPNYNTREPHVNSNNRGHMSNWNQRGRKNMRGSEGQETMNYGRQRSPSYGFTNNDGTSHYPDHGNGYPNSQNMGRNDKNYSRRGRFPAPQNRQSNEPMNNMGNDGNQYSHRGRNFNKRGNRNINQPPNHYNNQFEDNNRRFPKQPRQPQPQTQSQPQPQYRSESTNPRYRPNQQQYQPTQNYQKNTKNRGRGRGRERTPNNQTNTQHKKYKNDNSMQDNRILSDQQINVRKNKFGSQVNKNNSFINENESSSQRKSSQSQRQSQSQNSMEDADQIQEQQQEDSEESNYNGQLLRAEVQIDDSKKVTNQKCTKEQFDDRMKTFQMNNPGKITLDRKLVLDATRSFSLFEISKQNNMPNFDNTLKRFKRSAEREGDGGGEQEQSRRRSLKALINVMEHINKYVIDSDNMRAKDLIFPMPERGVEFIQIYDFLWDRMREMIKDITRLSEEESRDGEVIEICEQISRFFIVSINEGRKKYQTKNEFDAQMNKESLIKILTPLMDMYTSSRMRLKRYINRMRKDNPNITATQIIDSLEEEGIYISQNQPEMTSYAMLFSKDCRKYLYEQIFVGFEPEDQNPLYSSDEVQGALQIHSSIEMKNFQRYFHILEQKQTDYVLSCLMLHHIESVRRKFCEAAIKNFKYVDFENNQCKGIASRQLKNMLRFKENEDEEFQKFLYHIGAAENNQGFVSFIRNSSETEGIYSSPAYQFDQNKILRENYCSIEEIPTFAKKVKNNEQFLTRRETIGRTWYNSDYAFAMVCAYMGEQYEKRSVTQNNQQVISSGRQIQPQKVIEPNQDNKSHPSKASELLGAFKKKKFLKGLTDKLVDLLRPDAHKEAQKKIKLTNLLNIILRQVHNSYIEGLTALEEEMRLQEEQQMYLLRIKDYNEGRDKFLKEISVVDGNSFENRNSSQKMSTLLHSSSSQSIMEQSQIFSNLLNQAILKGRPQKFTLKIFVSNRKTNNILMRKIIENIVSIVAPEFEWDKFYYSYVYERVQIKIVIVSMKGVNDLWKKLVGVNCAIILRDSRDNCSFFEKAIEDLKQLKLKVDGNCGLKTNIGLYTFISSLQKNQIEKTNICADSTSLQFQSTCAMRVPKSLEIKIANLLKSSWDKYEISPQLSIVSFVQFFSFLALQAQSFVNKVPSAKKQNLFNLLAQFTNRVLKDIVKLNIGYCHNFDSFENWVLILQKLSQTTVTTSNLPHLINAHLNFLKKTIARDLKLQCLPEVSESNIVDVYHRALLKNGINKDEIQMFVKKAQIEKNDVENTVSFFQFIWTRFGKAFNHHNIIIPLNYSISYSPQQIQQTIKIVAPSNQIVDAQSENYLSRDINEALKLAVEGLKCDLGERQASVKRKRFGCEQFKYEREQWMRQAKKRLKMI